MTFCPRSALASLALTAVLPDVATAQCQPTDFTESEPNNDTGSADLVGPMDPSRAYRITGALQEIPGEFDVFFFSPVPGQVLVEAQLTPVSQSDVLMIFADSNGAPGAVINDAGSGQPEMGSITVAEPFYVIVWALGDDTDYELEVGMICPDPPDCNGNGVDDGDDIASGTSADCDSNGIPDECQPDCSGDGVPDTCEPDCDGDATPDACEPDCDADGVPDDCEEDCDDDGVPDDCASDCNGNGAPDGCEILEDCDGDGTPDECQIAQDPGADLNNDGILDSCQCLVGSYCIAAGNSNGTVAEIGWAGSTSIVAGDFTLTVQGATPLQFGQFFFAQEQGFSFLGDGALCVDPPLKRLEPIIVTDGTGAVAYVVDFSEFPASTLITPFSTWNFQFWYRDPFGGGAGFNFSDGLEATLCP